MPTPPAGQSSTFRDASFVGSYGPTGFGKTVDQVAAFPRAVWFTHSREFKSVITTLGIPSEVLRVIQVRHLYDVEAHVDALIKARGQNNPGALYHTAVGIDDMTVLAYLTEQALRSSSGVQTSTGTLRPKGWDLWTEQRNASLNIAFSLAERLKQAGLHFVVNGHVRVGRVNNAGKIIRGGIDLATDLAETFAATAEFFGKIEQEPERLFQPSVFAIRPLDTAWVTKNRLVAGLPERIPANTAEIMRAAGYALPRPLGMEGHEAVVENLATYLTTGFGKSPMTKDALKGALAPMAPQLIERIPNPLHVRWIMRDAIDRAWIRQAQARSIFNELGVI